MGAHKDDAVVGMVYDPSLNRAASLEQDLEFFAGKEWKAIPVVQSAADYADHLTALGQSMPRGLVAHAYVRYLGDLSGGQPMDRLEERCRELLLMLFRDDGDKLPYEQVARQLGVAVGSIGATRSRCLAKLRRLVEPHACPPMK